MNAEQLMRKLTITAGVLILVNLVPVFGVLFFDWSVFALIFLYWLENVILGLFNIVKLLFNAPQIGAGHLAKLFFVPFFTLHYGIFTFVHGMFVLTLFGGDMAANLTPASIIDLVADQGLIFPVAAFVASHWFSLVWNYFYGGERHTIALDKLMFSPYSRIVVLHLTILIGGFLMQALDSPIIGLIFLIGLKTVIDTMAHLREHAQETT